jgi:3-hydroxyacyl-CoA dehydrogenase
MTEHFLSEHAMPGIQPAEIARAAVVGLGTMGAGIAQAFATAGVSTVVLDENPAAVQKGLAKIRNSLEKRAAQGKLTGQQCQRALACLHAADRVDQLRDPDLAIEAVFEDLDTKRRVLVQIESVCRGETILATNTSTINLDQLAEALRHPQRLLGMHFFNPAHHMPLVEIIRREATPAEHLATTMHFAERIGKRPVLVRNREGFLVNRLFIPYLKEAFWLLEEGADPAEIDGAMVDFGFPMGPLAVSDLVGLDIVLNADRVMGRVFPYHGSVSRIAMRLVEAGCLGQKTGSGAYRYEPGDNTPHPSGVAQEVVGEVQRELGRTPRPVGRDEIVRRLVFRMAAEAFRVVEEGVAASESDLDAATVLGVGFPEFRGGVLTHSRDLGLATVARQLTELSAQCGLRYEPCEALKAKCH